MKNYFYKIMFACFLSSISYSQQVNNTEFKTKTLQVFQNLDKNRIPHGILLDFGMEFTNLKAFNGTLTDSTFTTSQTMSDIYKTLLMCRVRSNVTTGFITPEEYATRWYTQRTSGVLILSGQYFKYNRFADNAYPSKLNYSNNQFSDKFIGSTWQNPYDTKLTFAIAPSVRTYKGYSFSIKMPNNLWLTNVTQTVQSIQIDANDGLGYRTTTFRQNLSVAYTTSGLKHWYYKVTLSNGQILYSHSKILIEEGLVTTPHISGGSNLRTSQAVATNPTEPEYGRQDITATLAYNGGLDMLT